MRTDDYDLRRTAAFAKATVARRDRRLGRRSFSGGRSLLATGNFRLDIVARLSAYLVAVSSGAQSGSGERIFYKIRRGIQLCLLRNVALADFSRKLLHIGAQLFTQQNFIWRQRPRLRNILAGHPHSKPPK